MCDKTFGKEEEVRVPGYNPIHRFNYYKGKHAFYRKRRTSRPVRRSRAGKWKKRIAKALVFSWLWGSCVI